MKKTFKRAGVAVLSMAMLLSMGAVGAMSANAAGESIKVTASNGLTTKDDVKIYKVAAKTASGWAWTDPATDPAYKSAAETAVTNGGDFTKLKDVTDDADKKKLATALATVAKTKNPTASGKVGTAIPVEEGYYVVLVSPAKNTTLVQPILEEIGAGEAFVLSSVKSEEISLSKKITAVNGATGDKVEADGKNAMAKVGDEITYKIVAPIPSYDASVSEKRVADFVLTDTFQDSLTYESATAIVGDTASATSASAGAPTVTPSYNEGTTTFTASLTGEDLLKSGGKFLIVTFKATLNDNAVISQNKGVRAKQADTTNSADANKNDVTLKFGNDYMTGRYFDKNGDGREDEDEKPELKDYADVYTSALYINKTLNGAPAAAKDVGFTLYADDGTTVVRSEVKTDASGKVSFKGLDAGEYVLKETTGKAGYKTVGPVTVTIKKDGSVSKFSVPSSFTAVKDGGFETTIDNPLLEALPGTGGMGTVLFTVGGAAIVLLAGALFVVYMRKRKADEE